jgi:hypothetical protein
MVEAMRYIEDWFVEMDIPQLHSLLDTNTPAGKRRLADALRFIAELSTDEWLRDCNRRKGIAPPSQRVVSEFEERHFQKQGEVGRTLHLEVTHRLDLKARRMWAMRFRERWRTMYGTMPARDIPDLDELRGKVLASICVHVNGPSCVLAITFVVVSLPNNVVSWIMV